LRQRARANRSQQSGEQIFIDRRSFKPLHYSVWVTLPLVAVRQKEMRRKIRWIGRNGPRSFTRGDVDQPGIVVSNSEIDAAHGAILVEQQRRTIEAAIVI